MTLHQPVPHAAIVARIPKRLRDHVKRRLEDGGLLPPASFLAVVEAVRELSLESRQLLDRYSVTRRSLIARIPPRAKNALAYQKEAVATALSIAGVDRTVLHAWEPQDHAPGSFLDGLPEVRAREDAMVVGDLTHVPGFDLVRTMPYGVAVFQNENVRLTVVLANHLPLEEQLGADLVYFNETYRSFVVVQYKAMEKSATDGPFFRLPDVQLTEEIARMQTILDQFAGLRATPSRTGYRLLENPFFLKLCSRIVFDPDNVGLVPGMYIPLDYWRTIEADQTMTGPRGGRRVDFSNIGRYLNNRNFMALVTNAWVGTNVEQTAVLEEVIRMVIQSGRTLTIAVKTEEEKATSGGDAQRYDEDEEDDDE